VSAVTLPGTLTGLLRRGAPVFYASTTPGVVTRINADGTVEWACGYTAVDWADSLALDLTDPAGCDVAVRWGIEMDTKAAEAEIAAKSLGRDYLPNRRHIAGKWHALRDNPEALAAACLAVSP
jgi:hypothetical protein